MVISTTVVVLLALLGCYNGLLREISDANTANKIQDIKIEALHVQITKLEIEIEQLRNIEYTNRTTYEKSGH